MPFESKGSYTLIKKSPAVNFCLFKEVQGDRKTDEPQSGANNATEKDKSPH
jgi:hypothetical protein